MPSLRLPIEYLANTNAIFDYLILKRVLARFHGSILDVGSGYGRLKSFLPSQSQYVSIDLHPAAKIQQDICQRFSLRNETFDGAICNAVLEHVACPDHVMSEIVRVVKPGGLIWLSIPFLQPYHPDPTDYRRFTPEGFREYVKQFKLKIIREYPVNGMFLTIEHLLFFEMIQYVRSPLRWLSPWRWLMIISLLAMYSLCKIINWLFWFGQRDDAYATTSVRLLCQRK